MSKIADIAQAVTDELNAGSFSQSFTAERAYLPVFELKDMATLHVTVVPKGRELETVARTIPQEDVQIDVAVQQKLADVATESGQIDALLTLVEEIGAHFARKRLAGTNALWLRTENVPVYDPDHLREMRQLTSVLTLTFRVIGES